MPKRSVLGLFTDESVAADAMDSIREAGYTTAEYEVLTGTPYPEGTFGEEEPVHKLYRWPLIGAACGFIIGIVLTAGTQLAYPLVTGGKPILSLPPMALVTYEATMLGAILFTVLGIIFESRLPGFKPRLYDDRVTQGYIGVHVTCDEDQVADVEQALTQAGAVEVKRGEAD